MHFKRVKMAMPYQKLEILLLKMSRGIRALVRFRTLQLQLDKSHTHQALIGKTVIPYFVTLPPIFEEIWLLTCALKSYNPLYVQGSCNNCLLPGGLICCSARCRRQACSRENHGRRLDRKSRKWARERLCGISFVRDDNLGEFSDSDVRFSWLRSAMSRLLGAFECVFSCQGGFCTICQRHAFALCRQSCLYLSLALPLM